MHSLGACSIRINVLDALIPLCHCKCINGTVQQSFSHCATHLCIDGRIMTMNRAKSSPGSCVAAANRWEACITCGCIFCMHFQRCFVFRSALMLLHPHDQSPCIIRRNDVLFSYVWYLHPHLIMAFAISYGWWQCLD